MKKKRFIVLCIICILLLTGCAPKEKPKINDKLDAEILYIEDLIFKIANKYAKKEYIQDDKINFDYIKDDVNRINDLWGNLILDLTEVNVSNEEILDFSNKLNDLIISISKKDELKMIDYLSELNTQLIGFKASYTENKNNIKRMEIKNDILEIFNLVNKSEFNLANDKMDATIQVYKSLMNDDDYAKENFYNLKKIYILLEEYKTSLVTENFDLISIKYINTIENL